MFMDSKYLIGNRAGRKLFKTVRDLPVIDPHNHVDVAALAANSNFTDLWELFGATDHYVWEMMRKCAVEEKYITGNASNREKFFKFAEIFPDLAGNPCYEWMHLDLRRYLGCDLEINAENAEKIWKLGKEKLARQKFRQQNIIEMLNVEVMCSTDDAVDLLEDHDKVNASFGRTVLRPTWRPDKAMKILAPGWNAYLDKLGTRFDRKIESLEDLFAALRLSHDYFAMHNCRASDHGIDVVPRAGQREAAERAFLAARGGGTPDPEEAQIYLYWFLREAAANNVRNNFVMQIHAGAVRDVRSSLFSTLGPDSGGDICDLYQNQIPGLTSLLDAFDGKLKCVLYCLDPGHQPELATLTRAFGANIRLGSAWWLCDSPIGMKRQLEYVGSVDLLSAHGGMVSDSRKLLSFGSRFEMFRRVLCDVVGHMVEMGQIPEAVAEKLVRKICYDGPKAFFRF
ncbi:MAG: glucuronate isomerase [Victivallaceae bacterium]|nr:glucuronate isomerase [Victivallaceae bacterium]